MPAKSSNARRAPVASSSTADLVTGHYEFCAIPQTDQKLFAVNAGIYIDDALDQLSLLINHASEVSESIATSDNEDNAASWAVVSLLAMAFALTQAIHKGVPQPQRAAAAINSHPAGGAA